MRLGGRDQKADLVGTEAGIEVRQRTLDGAHVGAGRLVVDARLPFERPQELARIRELRHHFRIGVGGGLDAREAERREALDQRALGRGGHEGALVLQAVAREALAERHRVHR